jgi:hypothetical protein
LVALSLLLCSSFLVVLEATLVGAIELFVADIPSCGSANIVVSAMLKA